MLMHTIGIHCWETPTRCCYVDCVSLGVCGRCPWTVVVLTHDTVSQFVYVNKHLLWRFLSVLWNTTRDKTIRRSPINITAEGTGLAWEFSFNLFCLLMIGYQIPICLSCSLPSPAPRCSLEDCFGKHLEAGSWIGPFLQSPVLQWAHSGHGLRPRSTEEAEPVVGVGKKRKGACKNTLIFIFLWFCLMLVFTEKLWGVWAFPVW